MLVGGSLGAARSPFPILALLALLASAGPAHGQRTGVKAVTHGDWLVTCDAARRCFATHQANPLTIVVGRATDNRTLRVALLIGNDTKPGAPVTLLLDTNVAIELLVSGCEADRCEAAVDAAKTQLVTNAFKRAGSGVLAYQAGQRIRMQRFSLRGSTAAIQAVER